MTQFKISRRMLLSSTGAVLMLPLLESLHRRNKALAAAANDPRRYVGIYFPNGTYNRQGDAVWYPPTGKLDQATLTPVLQPFTSYLGDFSVLKFINNDAQQQMAGKGGHVSAVVTHFTAEPIGDTKATTCQVQGSSFDQYVVGKTGKQALTMITGCLEGSYYPDAAGFPYGYPYMWFNNGKVIEPNLNPVDLYKKVLSQVMPGTPVATTGPLRPQDRKSGLDATVNDIQALQRMLGKSDQQKLDDYLTSIRNMETQLQNAPTASSCADPGAPSSDLDNTDIPASNPNYVDRIKAFFDVVAFAFKCDLTRAAGISFDGDGANRNIQRTPSNLLYMGADPSDVGTHSLSHFESEAPNGGREKNITRDRLFLSLVFHLVDNLKASGAVDPSGSAILDNTIIDAGYSIVDGNHKDGQQAGIPRIVAGGKNFMHPGNALDCSQYDIGDMFFTYSNYLGLGLTDFKGHSGTMPL